MKLDTPDHPKFVQMRSALGIPEVLLVGHMELLWHFTSKHAPRGDIGKWSNEAIEVAVRWEGEPGMFLKKAIQEGFVCESKDHRLLVHDWPDHMMEMIKKRLRRQSEEPIRCHCRDNGSRPAASGGRTADIGCPPDLTLPDPTLPDLTRPEGGVGGESSGGPSSGLVLVGGALSPAEEIWEQVNSTLRSYMPRARVLILSDTRRKRMANVEKEFGKGSAVGALNGYAAMHLTEPVNGSAFKPLKNFNPETCWRACNIAKYLDANNAAEDLGLLPPYLPPDPKDAKAAKLTRMFQELRGRV